MSSQSQPVANAVQQPASPDSQAFAIGKRSDGCGWCFLIIETDGTFAEYGPFRLMRDAKQALLEHRYPHLREVYAKLQKEQAARATGPAPAAGQLREDK